ncbi:MAG: hypothetical protein ACJATV_001629 [Granulosicoccus sp.]|jgi:hypothetical protein
MNKTLYLTSILIFGCCLPTAYAWSQAAIEEEPTEEVAEQEESAEETEEEAEEETEESKKAPTRLSSRLPRSTMALDPKHKMSLLVAQLSNGEAHWLNDGKSEFLAIWQEDRSGDAQGALLILHAEGENPSWPRTTQPLHDSLPEYGWATMAIQLPDPVPKQQPTRTLDAKVIPPTPDRDISNEELEGSGDTVEDDGTNKEESAAINNQPSMEAPNEPTTTAAANTIPPLSAEEIEAIAEKRLTAAIKFLHDKGQFNIVLMGNGTSAIRGHKLMRSITPIIEDARLKKKIEKPIRGSIIFNARNKLPSEKKIYEDWFFDPEIPVLDVYISYDIRNERDAKVRKTMGKRDNAVAYKQIKITEISYEKSWKENQLSRRVRSFLDAYIQGIEVENARFVKKQAL